MILQFGQGAGGVAVQVDSPGLVEPVGALFPRSLVQGAGRPSFGVREVEMGFELTRPGPPKRVELFRSLPDLMAALEHALCRTLLAGESGAFHLHASGAVVDGRAVLALGPSGSGKSSLAFAWSRAGHPLLGDDVVLVDPDGGVRPFRRLLKVHRDVLAAAGGRPEETLAFDPEVEEVWYDPPGASGWAEGPVPVGLVAVARFGQGGPLLTEALEDSDALRYLLDSVMDSGLARARALDVFIPWLTRSRAMAVSFSSSRDAAELLAERSRASLARANGPPCPDAP